MTSEDGDEELTPTETNVRRLPETRVKNALEFIRTSWFEWEALVAGPYPVLDIKGLERLTCNHALIDHPEFSNPRNLLSMAAPSLRKLVVRLTATHFMAETHGNSFLSLRSCRKLDIVTFLLNNPASLTRSEVQDMWDLCRSAKQNSLEVVVILPTTVSRVEEDRLAKGMPPVRSLSIEHLDEVL